MSEEKKTNTAQPIQAKSNTNAPVWNAAPLDSRRLTSAYVDTASKKKDISLNASKSKRD